MRALAAKPPQPCQRLAASPLCAGQSARIARATMEAACEDANPLYDLLLEIEPGEARQLLLSWTVEDDSEFAAFCELPLDAEGAALVWAASHAT